MNTEQKITTKTWSEYASKVMFNLSLTLEYSHLRNDMLGQAIAAKVSAQEFLKAVEPLIEQLKKEQNDGDSQGKD